MSPDDLAMQHVLALIGTRQELGERITVASIRDTVEQILSLSTFSDFDLDFARLVRIVEANVNVHVGSWNSLSDDSDHIQWLDTSTQAKLEWKYWPRYQRFLAKQMPRPAITRLDEITDNILGRLESPARPGAWDRRGLVAGQVQSGKTGNYVGLIAKALDSGYKLVVVLAGAHNSLRSQTQYRIDEGVLGFDTQKIRRLEGNDRSARIGVGQDVQTPLLYVSSFTSSDDKGDFKEAIARAMGIAPGGSDPIVMVVKKNKSILTNLYKWATALRTEQNPETGDYKVRNVPVLLIDDEADHYSVNTKGSGDDGETEPSAINALVRQFLHTFEQTSYVGYTATPFANIFIDSFADHEEFGQDLFPRSFILNLPAPSNYMGPEQVFGLSGDAANEVDKVPALPISRPADDFATWLPDKHKASHVLGNDLPPSLREAILFFLFGGAVRSCRGDANKHQSMLIHVTRFTNPQSQVKQQVSDFLEEVTNRLDYGEGGNDWLARQLESLYVNDFLPTSRSIAEGESSLSGQVGETPSLAEIMEVLPAFAGKTKVHLINGTSDDLLEYVDHPDGLSVIAIGGDKLSRGLTLEGLSVSYFLRASRMYDTLMQMGRWFGYRQGYLDVCRLYTTPLLVDWYERITGAAAELQREFDAMSIVGKTPMEFGLRVRQHPDGLMVTSSSKLRSAEKIRITFSGAISETVAFDSRQRAGNLRAVTSLVGSLGDPKKLPYGFQWSDVKADDVMEFLRNFKTVTAAYKANPQVLLEYVRSRVAVGELSTWTVLLASVSDPSSKPTPYVLDGLGEIGLTQREHQNVDESHLESYRVKRSGSPSHETLLLKKGTPEWSAALETSEELWKASTRTDKSPKPPKGPSGLAERRLRDKRHGLLLIYPLDPSNWEGANTAEDAQTPFFGFVLPFPMSDWTEPVEYQVNSVWMRQEFDLGGVDDE